MYDPASGFKRYYDEVLVFPASELAIRKKKTVKTAYYWLSII